MGETHYVSIDPVGIGPIGLDRHRSEATVVYESAGDPGPLRVKVVRAV